jgi:hypothetical protein
MVRRITFTIGLVMSLLFAQQASATPVTPVDHEGITLGAPLGTLSNVFLKALGPGPPTTGTLESAVYLVGSDYFYVHTVTPSTDDNTVFAHGDPSHPGIPGFTGVAGFSFGDASAAEVDFVLDWIGPRLLWFSGAFTEPSDWDSNDPISFFFVSTRPPTLGGYSLAGGTPFPNFRIGGAESFAPSPVPEPGSIVLFGSGLVGLYAAMRRRRNRRDAPTP